MNKVSNGQKGQTPGADAATPVVLLVGVTDDGDILGTEVDQFNNPIGKEEDFYVRVGPGSRRLSTSEVLSYMSKPKLELT